MAYAGISLYVASLTLSHIKVAVLGLESFEVKVARVRRVRCTIRQTDGSSPLPYFCKVRNFSDIVLTRRPFRVNAVAEHRDVSPIPAPLPDILSSAPQV